MERLADGSVQLTVAAAGQTIVYTASDADPAVASIEADTSRTFESVLGGGAKRALTIRGQLSLRAAATSLHYRYTRTLVDEADGTVIREKTWAEVVPRDHH